MFLRGCTFLSQPLLLLPNLLTMPFRRISKKGLVFDNTKQTILWVLIKIQ
jgi:hypothetical protein